MVRNRPRTNMAAICRAPEVSGACRPAAPGMAFVGGRGPRVRPMFRNRDRMVKVMVIVVSAAMVLALVLPFLALLGN